MAFQREIEIDKERVASFLKNALNKVMTFIKGSRPAVKAIYPLF